MNDKDFERIIDEAIDITVPDGLARRLEARIDLCASVEQRRRRLVRLSAGAVAAAVLIAAGIFITVESNPSQPVDTYTDPAEAALAAEYMLTYMSKELNKGINQASAVVGEFEKVNNTLDKYFNK
ncbi:MAG: hypothetical protein LBJ58_01360 [Tannerellaceae bacterium]|jgi:hypothetical protein|nr:hypothetical protein [Tannerellaceae bacterium]